MASDSELKNLTESLELTLSNMRKAGITFGWGPDLDEHILRLWIKPWTGCEVCNRWSAADRCLWCKPDDFDGGGVA